MSTHGMKVYVAGKTQALEEVRVMQKMAQNYEWTITYDWTKFVEEHGPGSAVNDTLSKGDKQKQAENDMAGVYTAHVVIAVGHPNLAGTLWECGMAAAWGKQIWTFRWDHARYTIFNELPHVTHFGNNIEALRQKLREPYAMYRGLPPYDRIPVINPQHG